MCADDRVATDTQHTGSGRGRIRIMLAAPDDELRAAVEATLRRSRLGHALTTLDNVADMLHALKRTASGTRNGPSPLPNLILACPGKDDMDDEALFGELKGDPRLRTIPVIIFAHKGERMRAARLYRLGASSVIQLPLYFTDLVDIMFVIEQYWGRVARVPDTSR